MKTISSNLHKKSDFNLKIKKDENENGNLVKNRYTATISRIRNVITSKNFVELNKGVCSIRPGVYGSLSELLKYMYRDTGYSMEIRYTTLGIRLVPLSFQFK